MSKIDPLISAAEVTLAGMLKEANELLESITLLADQLKAIEWGADEAEEDAEIEARETCERYDAEIVDLRGQK